MNFVATADSSAGTSVCEEDNLADRVNLARYTRGGHSSSYQSSSSYSLEAAVSSIVESVTNVSVPIFREV